MTRILFSGDCEGNLSLLSKLQASIQAQKGPFDFCLCCGSFLPSDDDTIDSLKKFLETNEQHEFKAPNFVIPTYFVDTSSKAATEIYHIKNTPLELSKNLYFLGSGGVTTLHELKIAYISGTSPTKSELSGPSYSQETINNIIDSSKDSQIDILLTSEWPSGIGQLLDEQQTQELNALPSRQDGNTYKSFLSPEVNKLKEELKPRYHFSALSHIFYQFTEQSEKQSLGRVGLKGPSRKSFHALELLPSAKDPQQEPPKKRKFPEENIKPNVDESNEFSNPNKKSNNGPPEPPRETEVVALSNIAYELEEDALNKALTRFGDIKFLRFPKNESGLSIGKAWVVFQSSATAKAAANASEQLEVKGKKIRMQLWYGKIPYPNTQKQTMTRNDTNLPLSELTVNSEPQNECWFCLSNPDLAKYLLINIGSDVYTSLAKGGLVPDHLLIIPIKHMPSFFHCQENVRHEAQQYLKALRDIFQNQGKDIIVFERFLPMRAVKAMHSQIHIIPIPKNLAYLAQETFLKRCDSLDINLTLMEQFEDGFIDFPKVISHNQHSSYLYLELPGDLTARGKQVLRYVGLPKIGTRMPLNFCREVVSDLLGVSDRNDWRKIETSKEDDTEIARSLRISIKSMLSNN